MARNYTIRLTAYEKEQVRKVQKHVDDHLHLELNAEDLALQWDISLYKLKAGFEQLYHKTFAGYLKERRMERAMDLLRNSNKLNFDIARECGYKNDSTFVRAFRKWGGQTPDEFRKK